jgi:lactoylglutathione lyase
VIAALDHVGLSVADLDAGARALLAPGPSPEPGVRFAFLADPEGNLVELVERASA